MPHRSLLAAVLAALAVPAAAQTWPTRPVMIVPFAGLGTAPEPQDRATPAAHRAHWLAEIEKSRPALQAANQDAD